MFYGYDSKFVIFQLNWFYACEEKCLSAYYSILPYVDLHVIIIITSYCQS